MVAFRAMPMADAMIFIVADDFIRNARLAGGIFESVIAMMPRRAYFTRCRQRFIERRRDGTLFAPDYSQEASTQHTPAPLPAIYRFHALLRLI